jgi:hypothetical protein
MIQVRLVRIGLVQDAVGRHWLASTEENAIMNTETIIHPKLLGLTKQHKRCSVDQCRR